MLILKLMLLVLICLQALLHQSPIFQLLPPTPLPPLHTVDQHVPPQPLNRFPLMPLYRAAAAG